MSTRVAQGPLLRHIHELAANRPDAVALGDADGVVGYRELLDSVDRHACVSGEHDVVVIDAAKSRSTVVAMLAAMRHGLIAVPMDRDLPPERRDQILRQIHQNRLPDRWPKDGPDAPALVLFTSGSEGVPKGVVHSQASLLAGAKRVGIMLGLEPHDRLSQLHSLTYAASCSDLWGALVNGASSHLLDPIAIGAQTLIGRMIDAELTRWHLVPSLYRALLASPFAADALRAVRSVAVGGEAVHPEIVRAHHRLAPPGCELINRYSSTETFGISLQRLDNPTANKTNTDSTTDGQPPPMDGGSDRGSGVALGSAAPGVTVMIDADTGEIVVTSPSVALGYWPGIGSSDSEGRFTWPTGATNGGPTQDRSYRMGDLGRIEPDGTIVHLGRSDDLVKVAGHSVSLAEVRNALLQHPRVADAVAILNNNRIGAIVELRRPHSGDAGEDAERGTGTDLEPGVGDIVDHVNPSLRPAARPWPVVIVPAIPRTSRGKVDREAVRVLLQTRPTIGDSLEGGHTLAFSATAWAVRSIWIEVLDLDGHHASRLGIDDDWSDVGGTSLASIEVLARLAATFGVDLQPIDLARRGTIRALAETIDDSAPSVRRAREPRPTALLPLRHGEGSPTLFVPGAAGRSIQFVPLVRRLGGTYPCISVEPKGRIEPAWPDLRVEHAAARAIKDLARDGFPPPGIVVGYSMGCLVALEIAQRLVTGGTPPRWLLLLDYTPPQPGEERRSPTMQARAETVIAPLAAGRFPELLRVSERRRNHLFFRIGQSAARRYHPRPYPGPAVIGWSEAGLRAHDAWHAVVGPSTEVVQFSGNHHSFLHEPRVNAVAHLLDRLTDPAP